MHEMQTIVTDVRGVCRFVCPSVSQSVTRGSTRQRRVLCARGHSVQPLSNYFGFLLFFTHLQFYFLEINNHISCESKTCKPAFIPVCPMAVAEHPRPQSRRLYKIMLGPAAASLLVASHITN